MKRLLITGASGLLGSNIAKGAGEAFETYGVYHLHAVTVPGCRMVGADLRQANVTAGLIAEIEPDVIIHAAGLTDVDYCEDNPDVANEINVTATENVARAAARAGAKLVYISTDSVFDGRRGGYRENDEPAPLNVYARTKLAGERQVESLVGDHLILRTNIFGWNIEDKQTLAEWIYSQLSGGYAIGGFRDVFFTPLLVNDLATVIFALFEAPTTGIFHLGSIDRVSKFSFARQLADIFSFDAGLINNISIDEFDLKAPRPKDTSLDVSKVSAFLQRPMPSVKESLIHFKGLLASSFVDELKAGRSLADN